MRARVLPVLGLAGVAHGCTLLMPSDDELRGAGVASGAPGGGGSSGVVGGGGFPAGGASAAGGAGGAPASCASAADFSSVAVGAGRAPLLGYRAGPGDLALTYTDTAGLHARTLGLDGVGPAGVKLSSSASAKDPSSSYGAAAHAIGATWFEGTLRVGVYPPLATHPVYGADPTLPGGKSPTYAAIAGAPKASGFGIVWNGYGDSAHRLYALVVDASGKNQTGGDGYTRITDELECGDRNHQALVATADGYALAWSWAPQPCTGSGGDPDIYFATLDATLAPPLSRLVVEPAAGVSDWPALAFGGSDFGLAWVDDRQGTAAVHFARIAGSSVVAGSAVRLSNDSPTPGRAPSVAAGPDGYAVAWQSGTRVHLAVIASGASPSDVVLATDALAGETPSVVWAKDRWVVGWTRTGPELRLSSCAP